MRKKVIITNKTQGILIKTGSSLNSLYGQVSGLVYQKADTILSGYRFWQINKLVNNIKKTPVEQLPELLKNTPKEMFYSIKVLSAIAEKISSIKPTWETYHTYINSEEQHIKYTESIEYQYNRDRLKLIKQIHECVPEKLYTFLMSKINNRISGVLELV
ncbi:MAG: hypothetical protein ABIH39_02385 [Candidatus Margulisiibacteriota bacterium]